MQVVSHCQWVLGKRTIKIAQLAEFIGASRCSRKKQKHNVPSPTWVTPLSEQACATADKKQINLEASSAAHDTLVWLVPRLLPTPSSSFTPEILPGVSKMLPTAHLLNAVFQARRASRTARCTFDNGAATEPQWRHAWQRTIDVNRAW